MMRLITWLIILSSLTFNTDSMFQLSKCNPLLAADQFEGLRAGDQKELSTGILFRWCPAGTFVMGSPKSDERSDQDEDEVSVTLSSGFWLGETEVTQGQWQRLMDTTPWKGQKRVKLGDKFAASYINHHDAVEFCKKLTDQEQASGKMPKGWKYSLPTEAQREYACRAGTTTKFSFGSNESALRNYGWFDKNGWDAGEEYAHEVGLKKPNPWGLYDMHGNLSEWCSDWYSHKRVGGQDPQGPPTGSRRSLRGGSWSVYAVRCRSAQRFNFAPNERDSTLGFRIAVVPD